MTDLRAEATGYALRFINESSGSGIAHSRRLLLILKPNDQKLTQFNLLFSSDPHPAPADITKLPDATLAVRVYLQPDEFAPYYDVLRSERPIKLQIQFEGTPLVNVPLPAKFAMLFTDIETAGEGPVDASAL